MHMEYNNLRNKLNKFCKEGKITRYQLGGMLPSIPGTFDGQSDGNGNVWDSTLKMWKQDPNTMKFNNPSIIDQQQIDSAKKFGVSFSSGDENNPLGKTTTIFGNNGAIVSENSNQNSSVPEQTVGESSTPEKSDETQEGVKGTNHKLSAASVSLIGGAASAAINAIDEATMGDKNFSASSKAIDTGVHFASGALIKSGNPYAMIAGVALEGLNWITKAGGKTVQGYDVDINNSGYGNMGHMESESGRIWDNMSRKLAKRNEQARMALAAADVSEDMAFEQEARTNSVDNVLRSNQIALAGGIDLNLLGS